MKKSWLFSLLLVSLALFGCQDKQSGTLDKTELVKVQPEGNVSKDVLKSMPISYEASSVEEGLDALPFDITLPKEFPFDAKPLAISHIDDFKHDGKKLRVTFTTTAKDAENVLLQITAHNFKVEYSGSGTEVKLSDDVKGSLDGGNLTFEKDGVYYEVSYTNENISDEQHKEQVIEIAKQML
ncbi:hypothetical protein ACFFJY_14455 [Fictibacillus aquaticus]|uniref:DUF4367 domain-containing protein n=1 Tax=Fictibacillus aquaticus TaxID=2021314 RepID=A0A235FDI3_9BACL|nr:hypothetical protein [Fictibacillus aquaticus]OYD59416.1 hypothetical protein CGZ90_05880 [Fictibacillus aquaticus]